MRKEGIKKGSRSKHEEIPKTEKFRYMYIYKNQHIDFFGAWSILLVHVRFTPNQGPKGFQNTSL
jgi:hypothetical protein